MSIRGGRRPRRDDRPLPVDQESYADAGLPDRDAERGVLAPVPVRREPASAGPTAGLGSVLRFLVFSVVLGALVLAALLTVLRPLARVAVVGWAYDNASALRIPFVADLVREDLGDALVLPAGSSSATVEFEVLPGDTPVTVAERLKAADLIVDERAFIFLAVQENLASRLRDGIFILRATMTPQEVVAGLVDNRLVVQTVNVTFREGLRIEQLTAKLQTVSSGVDPKAFYDLAIDPPPDLLEAYPWLDLPEGRSLEGYLYPATYTLVLDGGSQAPRTTARDLIEMMLDKFYSVAGDLLTVPDGRGMTFYQVLTLASIVEKEAALDEERALIAGVYQNRLDGLRGIAKVLNADPTVIYAVDTMNVAALPFDDWQRYSFWNVPPTAMGKVEVTDELKGYQTYVSGGLIPGPICTPQLASILAALNPDTESGYLFFVAIPDGGGRHAFAKTQAEHDANLRKYGYR